jgi:hypothetical protein
MVWDRMYEGRGDHETAHFESNGEIIILIASDTTHQYDIAIVRGKDYAGKSEVNEWEK